MNRCADCGLFDKWENLVYKELMYHTDIYGGIGEDSWYEHKDGHGCKRQTLAKQDAYWKEAGYP